MAWVEVITSVASPEAVGRRIELPGQLDDLVFEPRDGAWHAERLHATLRWNGGFPSTHAGPLQHGDVVDLHAGLCLRYLERSEARAAQPDLERTLTGSPRDPQAWLVWADWLADQGDDRASLVRGLREETVAERARRLGPLAALWRDGSLELHWRRGFLHSAVLRRLDARLELEPSAWVRELFRLEAAAFLEHVQVDLFALSRTPAVELPELSRAVRRAPGSVEAVVVGPVRAWAGSPPPRLRFDTFERCGLSGDGTERHFTAERTRVDTGVDVTLGPAGLTLHSSQALAVNGHPCHEARLIHGDVVELAGRHRWSVFYE